VLATLGSLGTLAALLVAAPPEFGAHWFDGKAELNGYRLTQPRYGQPRPAEAVMIWVTEPFSRSKHVKLDRPDGAGADRAEVLKLNHTRRFLTGVYPYTLMTSVFSPVEGDPAAWKVTFSAQEWCGHVFHQLNRRGAALSSDWRSYFEAEGDGAATLKPGPGALLEDELWFRVRELLAPFAPGTYQVYPSLQTVRLGHRALEPWKLVAKKGPGGKVVVPAGEFAVVRWELELTAGSEVLRRTVLVEQAYPRRIVAWEGDVFSFRGLEPARERAELTGSVRAPYWEQNRLGDEALRQRLGLKGEMALP
jgi:hypothetical protein